MMNKKLISYFILSFCLFLLPLRVMATGAILSFSGATTTSVGKEFDVILNISNIDDPVGIAGIGGNIIYDKEYLEFVSYESLAPFEMIYAKASSLFSGISLSLDNRIMSDSPLIKFTFKAKKEGSTTIALNESELSNSDSKIIGSNNPIKTINIKERANLSSNANLKNLKLSSGSISFKEDVTSYKVSVSASTSRITISATPSDNKAKINGAGSFDLSYGNNNFEIKVTAEDGTVKIYSIVVTRDKVISNNLSSVGSNSYILSTNNNLKSLTVNGYLNPDFNTNVTEYNILLASTMENVVIGAIPEDNKASINIIGDTSLALGETKIIKVNVTAENKSVKTYTLNVTRENTVYNSMDMDDSLDILDDNLEYDMEVNNQVNDVSSKDLFHILLNILISLIGD